MPGTVDTDQGGAWLTLREAADRLGISEKTARRRVKTGGLRGRQVCTQHGPTWQVWVDESTPGGPVDGQGTLDGDGTLDEQGTQAGQGPELLQRVRLLDRELVRLVDRLHEENRALAEAAAVWQTRADLLAMQLEQTRAELRALQAPQDAPTSPVDANLGAEPGEPTTEPSDPPAEPPLPLAPDPLPPKPNGRQPWWQRLVRWAIVVA